METPPHSKPKRLKHLLGVDLQTTPNHEMESEDSPGYFPCTQESLEGIDVAWDWNSPQTTQKRSQRIKKPKRLLAPIQSPKIPLQRYPSNKQMSNIEELHEELKALQQQLAQPDDESCLCVSPQQEQEFKSVIVDKDDEVFAEFDDMFNDSINEQLLVLSQKIEDSILKDQSNLDVKLCNPTKDNIVSKCGEGTSFENDNDDWDQILSRIEEHKLEPVNIQEFNKGNNIEKRVTNKFTFKKGTLQRTKSETNNEQSGFIKIQSGTVELHRTKSFEMDVINECNLSQNVLEDIEKKRQEALAKLEAKRKQDFNKTSTTIVPNNKQCTQEEIEMKRQQALAKLEAKRIQDSVERNRLEALKRLQNSRQQKATLVKSSLSKRL